jgi:hypothetical protein
VPERRGHLEHGAQVLDGGPVEAGGLHREPRCSTTSRPTPERADRVREVAPRLYGMPGCGAVTAAKIMGETALVTRFSGRAAFAQHAGLAPVPH